MIDFVSLPPTEEAAPPPPVITDARELLARFAATGEQDAFEEVVRRYGGMVFNLCYEVTGNRHDAEDAVQAAFLSLAVQTKSGTPVQAIGPWLQQVARRMSLDINRSRKRRKNREDKHAKAWEDRLTQLGSDTSGGAGGHGNPSSAASWDEIRQVVQQELASLPPKYRMPLILHYYGGLSRDEMARELNCRANTLGVRLHRGRELLAKRLAKRGIALSGVILGVLLTDVCRSIVTERLVFSTAQAAVLLSAGHPYACGVVSPQIVALAQRATAALANAKIRFAASLALLAGGAAAGAQVVSHAGWEFPRPSTWNLNKVIQFFAPAPNIRVQAPPAKKDDHSPQVAKNTQPSQSTNTSSLVIAPNWSPAAPLPRLIPYVGPAWPSNWQSSIPIPQNPQQGIARQAPQYPSIAPPNNNGGVARGVNTQLNISPPGTGGSGSSGSSNASTDPGGSNDSNIARQDRSDTPGSPQQERTGPQVADGKGKNNSQNPSEGGGVKHPPNNPDGSTQRDPFSPGEITNHFPIPPRLDITPTPTPGPVGPQVPPQPPADAEKVGPSAPAPAGDGPPHGGFFSDDVLHITTDYNPAGAESFEQILAKPLGNSRFYLGPNELLINKQVIVGHLGTGVATQTGGVHTLDSLYLGVIKTGHGLYQLSGGELRVTTTPLDPDAAIHTIEIGSAGEGLFLFGDANSTGRITQTGNGAGVNLTVAAIRSASGTLRGWGPVGLTGALDNNGRIIADGFGQDRTLDLTSFSSVSHDFSNRTTNGWFAVNHGRLALPAIPVSAGTHTYTWGGNNDDSPLTQVNSARITINDAPSDGTLNIALTALDRTDIPTLPSAHHFIGIWSFDAHDATGQKLTSPGGMDLLVRYDDALAAKLGLHENVLKLWIYDGQWERLDFDPTFVRNGDDHSLFVHTRIDNVSYFAVSAPEPGSALLLSIGAGLWLTRRRRK